MIEDGIPISGQDEEIAWMRKRTKQFVDDAWQINDSEFRKRAATLLFDWLDRSVEWIEDDFIREMQASK